MSTLQANRTAHEHATRQVERQPPLVNARPHGSYQWIARLVTSHPLDLEIPVTLSAVAEQRDTAIGLVEHELHKLLVSIYEDPERAREQLDVAMGHYVYRRGDSGSERLVKRCLEHRGHQVPSARTIGLATIGLTTHANINEAVAAVLAHGAMSRGVTAHQERLL
jgi:hypothetical protein